jgi:cysteinyl-tRNA synthetase
MNAMDDNLNTWLALTVIYDLLKSDTNDFTKRALIEDFDKVLSLDLLKEEEKKSVDEEYIQEKINERREAKANKDFALADKIRDELLSEGIKLIDTREGTTYEIV